MDRGEIESGIREIITGCMEGRSDPATLRSDVPIFRGGLGLDSIAAIELLLKIESRFDVRIDDDAFDIFDSLNLLVDYIYSNHGASSPSDEGSHSAE